MTHTLSGRRLEARVALIEIAMTARLGGSSRLCLGSRLVLGRGRCLLLSLGLAASSLGLGAIRGGPQSQVVAQELHDEGAVAVRFLRETIQLSNRIIKGLLGEVACAVGRVEDLVVEDGEVECQAEADGVGRGKLGLRDVGGALECESACVACFERAAEDGSIPCKPRAQRWRRPYASRQMRTRQGNGGSHPSCE